MTIIFTLTFTFPAFADTPAPIGCEDAATNNLTGNITVEKDQDNEIFNIIGFSAAAMTPFGVGLFGATAGVAAVLKQISDPKYSTWENWPLDRWTFEHTDPNASWSLSSLADKGIAGACDMIANFFFDITKMLTKISNSIIVLAFNTSFIASAASWIGTGVQQMFSNYSEGSLSWNFVELGLVFLLIYTAFTLIKGQFASTLSAAMIAIVAVGSVFFFAANCTTLITEFSSFSDNVTGVFLSGLGTYAANSTQGQNLNGISDPLNRGLVACGQSAWNVIVADPWAVALFGTCNPSNLKLTDGDNGEVHLIQNKLKNDDVDTSKISANTRIDTLILGTMGQSRDDAVSILAEPNSATFIGSVLGTNHQIDHGKHSGTVVGLNSNATLNHIFIALLTLLPAIAYFVLICCVALPIIFAQIVLVAMLIILPCALFALMIPVQGWSIATKYFKTLIGYFAMKLIYGLFLSLVLSVGTMIVTAILNSPTV